jgi:hypothetical protein
MAHNVATTILSMAKSMQESAFEQARWRINVSVQAKCQGPPYWYDVFIDFATDGKELDIKMKGRQRLLLRMSTEQSPITRLLLNELTAHFGGRAYPVSLTSMDLNLIAGRRKGDKWSFRKDAGMITRVDVGKGKPLEESLLDLKATVDQLVELAFETIQHNCSC